MDALTAGDFRGDRLLAEPRTALVAFVADWCGFCRRFLREAAPRAGALPVPFRAADVTDEASPLWDDFRLRVVPTLVLFRDGEPAWRLDGRLGLGLPRAWSEEAERAARGG